MDPLSIHAVLSSPLSMRSKMSTTNIDARRTTPSSDRVRTFPQTPSKQDRLKRKKQAPELPPIDETVRERRGFRPLSVLTHSVLLPFDFDATKAMEELEEKEKRLAAQAEEEEAAQSSSLQSTSSPVSNPLAVLPFSNESELSLRTFLAQTSPEDVHGPFSMLRSLPAPDLSQHPAFSSSPFAVRTEFPNLISTSTAEDVRRHTKTTRTSSSHFTDRTSGSSDVFGSSERKKFTFFDQRYTPQTTEKNKTAASDETSPLAKRQPKHRPIEIPYTSPVGSNEDGDRKKVTSGRLRKISSIFKSRSNSLDKPESPTSMTANESPGVNHKALEAYLRTVTNSPSFSYKYGSWFPRHPVTSRAWKSRNLKCTNCLDVCCACCGRACCAYRAAVMALETHKNNPQGRADAIEKIQQITTIFPYGKEVPTFLQCTRGTGVGAGCGKMVCPDCCGICPDEACADTQCRRCKRDPWSECEWHSNMAPSASPDDSDKLQRAI